MAKHKIEYEQLFTKAPIGVINTSFEGKILSVNPAMVKMFGYSSSEELINDTTGDITKLYVNTSDRDELITLFNTQKEVLNYECQMFDKDNTIFWVSINTNVVKSYKETYLQSFIINITHRKRLEEFKEDVNQIIHHGFKSPLTSIVYTPDLLFLDDNLEDHQIDKLKRIQKSGYRLLNMINISLDLYRMETNNYEFFPEPVDLIPLIEEIKTDLSELCNAYQNEIIITTSDDLKDFIISGDKLLCYVVFSNLTKNAIESTPPGKKIHIKLEDHDSDQSKTVIFNPVAIPPEIQGDIGKKYTTFGKKRGTGLGIYSSKLIVQVMNGTFKWKTSEKDGTYFIIYLPVYSQ